MACERGEKSREKKKKIEEYKVLKKNQKKPKKIRTLNKHEKNEKNPEKKVF